MTTQGYVYMLTTSWAKPAFKEIRLGFEITMYVTHR